VLTNSLEVIKSHTDDGNKLLPNVGIFVPHDTMS